MTAPRPVEKIDAELRSVQDAKVGVEAALAALEPLRYPLGYPARLRRDFEAALSTFETRIVFCLREKGEKAAADTFAAQFKANVAKRASR